MHTPFDCRKEEGREKGDWYPTVEPYMCDYLDVGNGHQIYYEQCGNPNGIPVLFFHGGPGGGCEVSHRRFFDPNKYRVVLFDQRGSGRSKPYCETKQNTTFDLAEDAVKLLRHLAISKAVFFGGSWGSTLALVTAIRAPECVLGLVVRGIFLGNRYEVDAFYNKPNPMFPEAWERYISFVPSDWKASPLLYYHCVATCGDREKQKQLAYEFARFEVAMSFLKPMPAEELDQDLDSPSTLPTALIEMHYFMSDCFLEPDFILRNLEMIPDVPISIVQGRYDAVCMPESAYKLHKRFEEIGRAPQLFWTIAGHAGSEPETRTILVSEMERMWYKLHNIHCLCGRV